MLADLGSGIVDVRRPLVFDDIYVHMEQCRPGVTEDSDKDITVKLFNWVQTTWIDKRETIGPDGVFHGFTYPIRRRRQMQMAEKGSSRRRR